MAAGKKTGKPVKMAAVRKVARKTSLAAFFRKLAKKPELFERFAGSPDGRKEVLKQFNLSGAHQKLLEQGCVRDILFELAGAVVTGPGVTIVIASPDAPDCGHPECKAFLAARKPK
jgi:hypothetical protein